MTLSQIGVFLVVVFFTLVGTRGVAPPMSANAFHSDASKNDNNCLIHCQSLSAMRRTSWPPASSPGRRGEFRQTRVIDNSLRRRGFFNFWRVGRLRGGFSISRTSGSDDRARRAQVRLMDSGLIIRAAFDSAGTNDSWPDGTRRRWRMIVPLWARNGFTTSHAQPGAASIALAAAVCTRDGSVI